MQCQQQGGCKQKKAYNNGLYNVAKLVFRGLLFNLIILQLATKEIKRIKVKR